MSEIITIFTPAVIGVVCLWHCVEEFYRLRTAMNTDVTAYKLQAARSLLIGIIALMYAATAFVDRFIERFTFCLYGIC